MTLTQKQINNLNMLRRNIIIALNRLKASTSYSHVKQFYDAIIKNVRTLPINFHSGYSLNSNPFSIIHGENLKRIVYKNGTPVLQSAIVLPKNHFFNGNKINIEGVLTLLHEYSHIVLPPSAQNFAHRLFGGVYGKDALDEFFADLGMVRLAHKIGIPKHKIIKHLYGRIGVHPGVIYLIKMAQGKDMREVARRAVRRAPKRAFPERPKRMLSPTTKRGLLTMPFSNIHSLFRLKPGFYVQKPKYEPLFRR